MANYALRVPDSLMEYAKKVALDEHVLLVLFTPRHGRDVGAWIWKNPRLCAR